MSYLLRYFNELTINGKSVDDAEEDTDYTDEKDNKSEENQETDTELDTNPDDNTKGEENETKSDKGSGTGDTEANRNIDSELDTNPDDTPQEDDTDGDTDYTLDDTDNKEDQETDTELDTNPDDTPQEDDTDGDTDYTSDNPEDTDTNSDDNTEGQESNNTDDQSNNLNDDESLESRIKQSEAEIFNTLSDEEKIIRSRQLIDDYIEIKKITKVFIEKVQTITVTDANKELLTFVEINLIDLNNMISDYIITRYNQRSYIENYITYQQFVLSIEQLKDIISKLNIDEKDEK